MTNIVIVSVTADDLELLGTRKSAGIVKTKFGHFKLWNGMCFSINNKESLTQPYPHIIPYLHPTKL